MDVSKVKQARDSIAKLSKDLTCPICLCLLSLPVARLPCCHYFCKSCIEQALRHTQRCPSCKGKAKRRDVREDGTVDAIVRAFQGVEAEIESFWNSSFHAIEQAAPQKRLSMERGESIVERAQNSLCHKELSSKDGHEAPPDVNTGCQVPASNEPSQIPQDSVSTNDPEDDPVASSIASKSGARRTRTTSKKRTTKSKKLSAISQHRGKGAQSLQPSEDRRRGSARLATWTCKSCTLINKHNARECEVCLAPRSFF